MGQRFVACDREQSFLMPPDVREWLPANHLAWFVIDAVGEMDLDAFYAAYRFDGRSRPPYDPAMMVALLLYAYARGVPSSREIERACVEDVAFRVIAAQQRPDHATIARFVANHQDAVAGLFGEVLTLCARSGLAQVGVIAIDGTKVAANASRDANLDYEQVARELVEQAIATDQAEDELYGEARGDELPPEFSTTAGRRGWLREAKKRLEAERSANPQPVRGTGRSGSGRPSGAWMRSLRPRSAPTLPMRPGGRAASPRTGRGEWRRARPSPTRRRRHRKARINVTDPDSKVVKGLRGWLQGYNAQAVTNEQHIILAAEIETVGADFGHLEPMLDAAQHELQAAGVDETPGVLLADAGYWHSEQMASVVDRGIVVLIPPDTSRKRTTRRNWEGGHYDFMRRVLSTEHGAALYRKRQPMIESVFAQVKFNRGLDRFRRRGRGAVRTEWRLITATHNLLKLHRHTLAAA